MKVGDSVKKAIDDTIIRDYESAMLHACNAVDGTAKKTFPNLGVKDRFTRLLRENYFILGPMGVPGINLVETKFPITLIEPAPLEDELDVADIIYGIHRCTHGHGDELPQGFDLLPDTEGPDRITRLKIKDGAVQFSTRIIFGLLSVAVFSLVNEDQKIPQGYFLKYSDFAPMYIYKWWGRGKDFPKIAKQDPVPLTILKFPGA